MVAPLIAAGARVAGSAAARAGSAAAKRGAQTGARGTTKNASRSTRRLTTEGRHSAASGVRNAQVTRRDPRVATSRFEDAQSIRARAQQIRSPETKDADFSEKRPPFSVPKPLQRVARTVVQKHASSQNLIRTTKQLRSLPWLLSVSAYISFWVFVFGFIGMALVFIGKQDVLWGLFTIDDYLELQARFSLPGLIAQLIGIDLGNLSLSNVGIALMFLASMLALISYVAIIVYLWITERSSPVASTGMLALTFFCMAADMIFVLQLFPWLMLWVFALGYARVGNAFSS